MSSDSSPKDCIIRLESDKPSKELQKKAFLELRETPENIETGLKELKQLLEAEKDILVPLNNEEWLTMFLRTCKFFPEGARDLVKRCYVTRHKYPEIINLLLPSKLKTMFDDNLVSFLPKRDQHGRRIIVSLGGIHWNYKTISQEEILAGTILCSILLQKEPITQINGAVYILDLEGLTFSRALRLTPYCLKRAVDFIQFHTPIRMKGFHIVNQPKIFQPLFASIKPFFDSKFANRILMHGNNYESLHRYISPECLPKCYGGALEGPLMHSRETFELLTTNEEFFANLQKFDLGLKQS